MSSEESSVDAELQKLQRETFGYFLHETNPANGLVKDKTAVNWPASIAATGLALAAYPIGVERGFLSRTAAVERTLATLRFFWNSRQGPEPDATGQRGFYYHFLDMQTGRRAWQCELSTVDSAFLLAGALAAATYFDAGAADEREIRDLGDALYRRADWRWAKNSRRATYVQRQYAIENPLGFKDYGPCCWGITASEGPGPATITIDGIERRFFDYVGRGVPYGPDDGTLAPWALVASLPFAPEIVLSALHHCIHQAKLTEFNSYGFKASFNPSHPGEAGNPYGWWVSPWHYGLNQGPIILMIENYRTEMLWQLMRKCEYIARGLRRAGFEGGWL